MPHLDDIRQHFPALDASPDVILDNAGGSQVPATVADAMRDYMLTTYVQLGADYGTSLASTATVRRAHDFVSLFVNGADRGTTILGPSCTALCNMLADGYRHRQVREPNNRTEIIVAETAHEANAGPWIRLGDEGWTVRPWRVDPLTQTLSMDALDDLLNERTALVVFPHVSNLLGRIEDAAAIAARAHDVGARVVVDGVAYAPHRAIDVEALDADWYVYSTYKVFGPHMAALYGRADALEEVDGPNHFFVDRDAGAYYFEPGGVSHEGCAGLLGLQPYLAFLADADPEGDVDRATIESAFETIATMETALQRPLIEWIRSREDLLVIGPEETDDGRVSTVSFVHESKRSRDIVLAANEARFGCRYGHFYAYRMAERLVGAGLLHSIEDGVVRVSMLHYNTPEEVAGLIDCFERILG